VVLDVPDDPAAQIRADLDPPGFAVFRVFLDQEVVALAIGVELLVDLDDDPADREGPARGSRSRTRSSGSAK
jgi:hypothetical protein